MELDHLTAKRRIAHKEWFAFERTIQPVLHTVQDRVISWHVDNLNVRQAWLNSGSVKDLWLKEVIRDSGSFSGLARDVRSVGASTAVQARFDIMQIMESANWKRLTTLQRHYFKPQSLVSLSNILNVTS